MARTSPRRPSAPAAHHRSIGPAAKPKTKEQTDKKFQESVERVRDLLSQGTQGEADALYDAGVLVEKMLAEASYGQRTITKLATALGKSGRTLREYGEVTKAYDRRAFRAVRDRKNKNGLPLSFSHLIQLAKEDDLEERERLTKQVLDEDLSVSKLRRLRNATGAEETNPPSPVRKLLQYLWVQLNQAAAEMKRHREDALAKVDPADLDNQTRDLLIKIRTVAAQLTEECRAAEVGVSRCLGAGDDGPSEQQ